MKWVLSLSENLNKGMGKDLCICRNKCIVDEVICLALARHDITRFTRSDIALAGCSDIIFAYKLAKRIPLS